MTERPTDALRPLDPANAPTGNTPTGKPPTGGTPTGKTPPAAAGARPDAAAPPSLFPGVRAPTKPRRKARRRRTDREAPGDRAPAATAKRRKQRRAAAPRPEPARFPPPPNKPDPAAAARAAQTRRRIMVGVGLLAVWGAVIGGRLVQTQVFHHDQMLAQAANQHHHRLTIPPFRGAISDRNGRPLALTVAAESVYAEPPNYRGADLRAAAAALAACLDRAPAHIERRLRRPSEFSWLRRKASREQAACARESGHPVGVIEEYDRAYPGGALAAHLVGYVGVDGNGLGGIEHALDGRIRGEPGRRTVWTDGRRTGRRSRVDEAPRPGADVRLTVDLRAQAIAEDELARGVEETGARGGVAILLESATGEVLALAGLPAFDPNRYGAFPRAALRNQAFTDPYEPGSVFKVVTAAAALEEGVTYEEEPFDTHGGRYAVGNRVVRDWQPLGPLTFAGVIRRSSNIGTLQVAARLGSRRMLRYIRAFGFGAPTGIGGPGESRGIVPAAGRWRPIRLATVSFGQGIAVTPAQMAQAVNVIASGGVRIPLRLTREVGGEPAAFARGERVVSEATAARMRRLLAGVVSDGTGRSAGVAGFEVAGKTGTAQKAVPGGYSETDYIASFAGFAPAERPLFTAVVLLDTSQPNHSGANAARVFGRIAARMLRRYRKAPAETPTLVARAAPANPAGLFAPVGEGAATPWPLRPARGGGYRNIGYAGAAAPLSSREAVAAALRRPPGGFSEPGSLGEPGGEDPAPPAERPRPSPTRVADADRSAPRADPPATENLAPADSAPPAPAPVPPPPAGDSLTAPPTSGAEPSPETPGGEAPPPSPPAGRRGPA